MDFCLIALHWTNPRVLLAILEVLAGFGFIIFVHELGHFLVAKLCGVKVEKFYLGFDIYGLRLCRFRWGETEYGIGILPLGGYVKMLGQEDNPARLREEMERAKLAAPAEGADQTDAGQAGPALFDPRSYLAKPVPQRIAIISAGVVMNMIFALVLGILAFFPGVQMNSPVIGHVAPGGGAWQAGLQVGDEVVEIDDQEIHNFLPEIAQAIALGDVEDGASIVVRRRGVLLPPILVPTRRIYGRPGVGIGPSYEPVLAKDDPLEDLTPCVPGSPAAASQPAFQHGDRFVKLDDQAITDYAQIRAYLALHPDRPIDVTVERAEAAGEEKGGTGPTRRITIRVARNPMRHFGLGLETGKITAIQRGGPAEKAGLQPGDVLQTVDGVPIDDPLMLAARLRTRAGEPVTLGVSGEHRKGTERVKATLRQSGEDCLPGFGSPVAVPQLGVALEVLNTVRAVQPGGPAAKKGLAPGDVLKSATIKPPSKSDLAELRETYGDSAELAFEEMKLTLGDEHLNWPCLICLLQSCPPGTTVELKWLHKGQPDDAVLTPVPAARWFNPDRGWQQHFEGQTFVQKADSFRDAVRLGSRKTLDATLVVFRSVQKIGSGQVDMRNLSGPWGIFKMLFSQALAGPGNLLLLLTMLSANLAVLNFLPIPVLDGGHLVLLLYEGIRGKPASERVQEVLTYIGLVLILALMIFVFGLDLGWISRPGPGQ